MNTMIHNRDYDDGDDDGDGHDANNVGGVDGVVMIVMRVLSMITTKVGNECRSNDDQGVHIIDHCCDVLTLTCCG